MIWLWACSEGPRTKRHPPSSHPLAVLESAGATPRLQRIYCAFLKTNLTTRGDSHVLDNQQRHVEPVCLNNLCSTWQGCCGDAAGMERAELCDTTLPRHSWAQRKKLLFVSPFWKWPKGSNAIYQNFSIQKQLSVFPGLQSVMLPHIRVRPKCVHSAGWPMCVQLKMRQYSLQRKTQESNNVYFQVNINCTSPGWTNTFYF